MNLTLNQTDLLRRETLPEYGSITIPLEATTAAAMHQEGHVSVAPSAAGPGQFVVTAKHEVGVLQYDDVELRITPKVPVSRLLYLATHIEDPKFWHEVDALLGVVDDPWSALAHVLAWQAELALRPSPLQGYVTYEAAEKVLRGRILFDQQTRRAGIHFPIDVRFDEFDLNTTENQVLKAGIEIVERHVAEPSITSRLAHLRFRLDGVQSWPAGQFVPAFNFNRLNERYRVALSISRLVLEGRSLEFSTSMHRGSAFLFNMNRIFERYVEVKLRSALASRGGRVVGQRILYLDEADTLRMKPDISWWNGERCLAVVDAKYKRVRDDNYPNADAYQLLAYCTRLGLPRGILVYADLDGSSGGSTVVRNAGVEIVTAKLDISGSIEELNASAVALADLVSAQVALPSHLKPV